MKLNLEDYSNWVSLELEKQLKPTESKARKLVVDSRRALEEAERFFQDLSRKGDKDVASKRDPVSYRAARLVSHAAKEASTSLSKLQVPQENTWDALKVFRESVSSTSRSLRELRSDAASQLSGFYILDMRAFGGFNDRILKVNERLTQFLEGEGSSLLRARTLNSILLSVRHAERELEERREDARRVSEEAHNLAASIKKATEEVDAASVQPALRELLETERELRRESREFRSASLAHLQRPLRKLRDMAERGDVPLGVDERKALGMYVHSPYRSFLSKTTGPYLTGIFETLKRSLESGKMGFKPRKAARVLAQVGQLLGSDQLISRQQRGRQLLSTRWKHLQDPGCVALYQARKNLIATVGENRRKQEELSERTRTLDQKLEALGKRVDELLVQAESKTREYTGREVRIERPLLYVSGFQG